MERYIEAAKATSEDISKMLNQKFPDTNFQYGYVFYRDLTDSKDDIHEIINLTSDVKNLRLSIEKIYPFGGETFLRTGGSI